MKKFIFALCTLVPLFAFSYVSNEGDSYQSQTFQNKAVLTSDSKKIYILDQGAGMSSKEGKHQISFFKNCKIQSNLLGQGKWFWANGGVFLEFENHEIVFPKQESPFESFECRG